MKGTGRRIVALCAVTVLGSMVPVHADSGLCNRFLAFVAQVRGDATGEFKRRIGFLLDAGKIGDEHLARMAASETAMSPFESGRHLAADMLPHQSAMARLLSEDDLNWGEIKRYIEKLRGDLKRGEKQRVKHEKATQVAFYPHVAATYKMVSRALRLFEWKGKQVLIMPGLWDGYIHLVDPMTGKDLKKIRAADGLGYRVAVFEEDGKTYIAVGALDGHAYVYDVENDIEVAKIRVGRDKTTGKLAIAPAAFKHDGKAYLVLGSHDGNVYVVEALTGKAVSNINLGSAPHQDLTLFEEGGKTYVAVEAYAENRLRVVEALTGKAVGYIQMGSNVGSKPTVFMHDGKAYVAVGSFDGYVYVNEAVTGKEVAKTKTGGMVWAPPTVFEKDGTLYLAVGSWDYNLYLMEALTGKVLSQMKAKMPVNSETAIVEWEGKVYSLTGSNDRHIYVHDVFTGQQVAKIKTEGMVSSDTCVFVRDRNLYVVIGTDNRRAYVVQLYGVPATKGRKK